MNKKNKQILIIEDNEHSMELICKLIDDIDNLTIFKAANSEQAYKYAIENDIELFIVDLILEPAVSGTVSGIKFIEKMRTIERYKFTPIIVTTSLEDPKLHTYAYLHCYRYFEKPYDKNEFKRAVLETLEFKTPKQERRFYYYRKEGILYSIKIDEIIYIKNNSISTFIYKQNKEVLKMPYKSCKSIMLELPGDKFIKCNKNTIINIDFIDNIDTANRYITLINGYGTLEIGLRLRKNFLNELPGM